MKLLNRYERYLGREQVQLGIYEDEMAGDLDVRGIAGRMSIPIMIVPPHCAVFT